MHAAGAAVAVSGHHDAVPVGHLVDLAGGCGHLGKRHRHVVGQRRGGQQLVIARQGREELLAAGEQPGALGRLIAGLEAGPPVLFADGLGFPDLEVDRLLDHAVGLEEQNGLDVGEPQVHGLVHRGYGHLVQELEHRRRAAAGHDLGDGLAGLFELVEVGHAQAAKLGNGNEAQGGLHHNRQGAFGAHDQAFELVAAGRHPGSGPQGNQLAVGQNHLHPQQGVLDRSVLDRAGAAGIVGDLAADGGDAGRGRSGRKEKAMRLECFVQVVVHHPRLAAAVPVGGVDLDDAVHALHVQDDPALDRHGLAAHGRPAATGDYGYLFLVGVAQQRLNLPGLNRPDHRPGLGLVNRGVRSVDVQVGGIVLHVFGAHDFL